MYKLSLGEIVRGVANKRGAAAKTDAGKMFWWWVWNLGDYPPHHRLMGRMFDWACGRLELAERTCDWVDHVRSKRDYAPKIERMLARCRVIARVRIAMWSMVAKGLDI